MNVSTTIRLVAWLVIATGSLTAQSLKPFFFDLKPRSGRFVHVISGKKEAGIVQGRMTYGETGRKLEIEGWIIDLKVSKDAMLRYGQKLKISTSTEMQFRATFDSDAEGNLVAIEASGSVARKQWLKAPYLDGLAKVAERIADAVKAKDGYQVDKTLFETRDVGLGTGEQEIVLGVQIQRAVATGPWRETWTVENAVGFDEKTLARESQSLTIILHPTQGELVGYFEVDRNESQAAKPFPARPLDWGKPIVSDYPPFKIKLPTGFELETKPAGTTCTLSGSFTFDSAFGLRGAKLGVARPPAWAESVPPLVLDKDDAAFFTSLSRQQVPRSLID